LLRWMPTQPANWFAYFLLDEMAPFGLVIRLYL